MNENFRKNIFTTPHPHYVGTAVKSEPWTRVPPSSHRKLSPILVSLLHTYLLFLRSTRTRSKPSWINFSLTLFPLPSKRGLFPWQYLLDLLHFPFVSWRVCIGRVQTAKLHLVNQHSHTPCIFVGNYPVVFLFLNTRNAHIYKWRRTWPLRTLFFSCCACCCCSGEWKNKGQRSR